VQITETNVVAGKGLVAQQSYKQGALILQEDALVFCNTRKRHDYWEDEGKAFYDEELNGTTKILQTAFNKLSLLDQATFHKFYTSNPRPSNVEHIVDRFRYSAFKVPVRRHGDEADTTRMVLYRTICFANHSCVPNATVYIHNRDYPDTRGQGRLVATRDIDNGEEILINYIPEDWHEDRADRQAALMLGWGFDCTCEGCDEDNNDQNWAERRICCVYFGEVIMGLNNIKHNGTKLRVWIDLLGELGKRDKDLSYA